MGKPRVKNERLRLMKIVQHAMNEAREHGCVHLHGTGSVEKYNETQRLGLALASRSSTGTPPAPILRRMVGAQIDAPALGAGTLAARQPRPHQSRQPFAAAWALASS